MKMNILKEKRLDVETPFCSSSTESSFGLGHLRIAIMKIIRYHSEAMLNVTVTVKPEI